MQSFSIRQLKQRSKTLITYPEKYTERKTPHLDMECFLQAVLHCDKTFLLAHDDYILTQKELFAVLQMCEKRKTGLPVAYITEKKEFFNLNFHVTPAVLIPKPDTELLVEKAIELIRQRNFTFIADICTGSGCIAVSILKNIDKKIFITASDISGEALNIAKINSLNLLTHEEQANIFFINADLFQPLSKNISFPDSFDLIVSNPPYIPSELTTRLLQDGRNEPRIALDGDLNYETQDGTGIIQKLIPQSFMKLKNNGILLLETGEYNADKTESLMKECGFIDTKIFLDLSGAKRVVYGLKP
jgi:release factor glutamine methyltransferase